MDEDISLEAQLRSAQTVGVRLRILRQRAGYSLRSLAEAAKIDKGYLSRIENNLVPPPADTTWDAYVEALLAPLSATPDEVAAESALSSIAYSAQLSQAAVTQVLRDYPPLQQLLRFVAWVGLSEEERDEVERLTSQLARRVTRTNVPRVVRGKRPIERERRSSAKAAKR